MKIVGYGYFGNNTFQVLRCMKGEKYVILDFNNKE